MNVEWFAPIGAFVFVVIAIVLFLKTEKEWAGVLVFGFALTLILAVVFGLGVSTSRKACRLFGEVNQWNHEFTVMNGCLLEVEPGRWIPKEAVYSQVEDLR